MFEWRLSIVYSCRKRSTENNVMITIPATIYLDNLHGAALYGAFVVYLLLNISYMWLNCIYNPLLLKVPTFSAVFWVGFCLLAFLVFPVAVRQHSITPEVVHHSFSRQTLFKLKWCNQTGRGVKSRQNIPVAFLFSLCQVSLHLKQQNPPKPQTKPAKPLK